MRRSERGEAGVCLSWGLGALLSFREGVLGIQLVFRPQSHQGLSTKKISLLYMLSAIWTICSRMGAGERSIQGDSFGRTSSRTRSWRTPHPCFLCCQSATMRDRTKRELISLRIDLGWTMNRKQTFPGMGPSARLFDVARDGPAVLLRRAFPRCCGEL